jgi:hypothetical protein
MWTTEAFDAEEIANVKRYGRGSRAIFTWVSSRV